MSEKKISELNSANSINSTDVLVIVQNNSTKKVPVGTLQQQLENSFLGNALPIGSITLYASDVVPENWLLCDGSAVSRTEYAALFNIIGTTYGSGDGSTTFNLPDLRGKVAVGKDSTQTEFDNLGETGGEKTHTLTVEEMPSHTHNVIDAGNGSNRPLGYGESSQHTGIVRTDANNNWNGHVFIASSTGGGQAHNNLQPYLTLNYIIKAKHSLD